MNLQSQAQKHNHRDNTQLKLLTFLQNFKHELTRKYCKKDNHKQELFAFC